MNDLNILSNTSQVINNILIIIQNQNKINTNIKQYEIIVKWGPHPGVPHAISDGSKSAVFLAKPKSAILMSESSVSKIQNKM